LLAIRNLPFLAWNDMAQFFNVFRHIEIPHLALKVSPLLLPVLPLIAERGEQTDFSDKSCH